TDDELEEETTTIARCPACDGSKKLLCPTCIGSARVRCYDCNGRGQVQGKRGPKNCPTCRGRGDVKCGDCRSGKVDCHVCDTAGRVQAWLVIARQRIDQVHAYPECASLLVHEHA